ncbi:MAG: hypothetical protein LBI65_01560 [Candidatus Symbiothrix sp.]|nr:hypothetical protein [Candidatus Symbiothrix sp.]
MGIAARPDVHIPIGCNHAFGNRRRKIHHYGEGEKRMCAGREASVTVTIGLPASEDISGNAQIQGSGHSRFFSSTTKETKPDEVAYTLRSNLSGSVTEIYSGTVTKKMSVRLNYRCVKTIDN